MNTIKERYDFILLFDCKDGNPNGDPDAGNMPRMDMSTGNAWVSQYCIKHKIRNYVDTVKDGATGFDIYIKSGHILNQLNEKAHASVDLKPSKKSDIKSIMPTLQEYMCKEYYDVRTFGAVMQTKVDCGQLQGPVQISNARSIDPVEAKECTLTRVAVTTENDAEAGKTNTMGTFHIIHYGLFMATGHISPRLAGKMAKDENGEHTITGFDDNDLQLLWDALLNMFEYDRAAARGEMVTRKLILFKHDSDLGNAPSHQLFERVKIVKNDANKPARSFNDYAISIDKQDIPNGVSIIELR